MRCNICPSITDSYQLLAIDSGLIHVNWETEEATDKVLVNLLATLWLETHPLVVDLLSLVLHNAKERQTRVDWVSEYEILPIHFICCLTLDLNTWCISVEEDAGCINIPSRSALCFKINRRTLNQPHMPPPATLHPGTPAL